MKRHREYSLKEYIGMCSQSSAYEDETTRLSTMQRNVIGIKLGEIKKEIKNINTETLLVFNDTVALIERVYGEMTYHRMREIAMEHEKLREKVAITNDLYQKRIDMEISDIEERRDSDFKMIEELREIIHKAIFPVIQRPMKPLKLGEHCYMPLLPDIYRIRQPLPPYYSGEKWKEIVRMVGPSISQVCTGFYHMVSHDKTLWTDLFKKSELCRALMKYGMGDQDVEELTLQSIITSVVLNGHSRNERRKLYQFIYDNDMKPPYVKCHNWTLVGRKGSTSTYCDFGCRKTCFPKHIFMIPKVIHHSSEYNEIRNGVYRVRQSLMDFIRKVFPYCTKQISTELF